MARAKKISFSMDGTEIQESQVRTKIKDSVCGIEIQDSPTITENLETSIGTKIHTIGTKTKNLLSIENLCPRTKIRDLE